MPTYYLYRHIRNDINQPFYIGVGKKRETGSTEKKVYSRAFTTWQRDPEWHSIASTTSFSVDILMESEDRDFLLEKEVEFISLYGRAISGDGPLVNIEAGGICGMVERTSKLKVSKAVYVYKTSGQFVNKFDILREAERELQINHGILCRSLKNNKLYTSNEYVFFNEYKGVDIGKVNYEKNAGRPILCFSKDGIFLNEIPTMTLFRHIANTSQRKAYQILENGEKFNEFRYIFKDLYNGPEYRV